MPRKPRKTDTARIAEWVGTATEMDVASYASVPDEKTLRWMYRSIWRSILEVYDWSLGRIKPASLEEIVRKVADRVATDIVMSRYPQLPPDRAEYYASLIANVIYSDIWRYIVSYLTVRRGIEEVEYREERIRRPRYRTSHNIIFYLLRRAEREAYGM
jgi:hypothetical protein